MSNSTDLEYFSAEKCEPKFVFQKRIEQLNCFSKIQVVIISFRESCDSIYVGWNQYVVTLPWSKLGLDDHHWHKLASLLQADDHTHNISSQEVRQWRRT